MEVALALFGRLYMYDRRCEEVGNEGSKERCLWRSVEVGCGGDGIWDSVSQC